MNKLLSLRYPLTDLKRTLRGLVCLIYPPICLGCGRALGYVPDGAGPWGIQLCEECKEQLVILREPFCLRCSTPFKSPLAVSHTCGRCELKSPAFDRLLSPFLYEGIIVQVISDFKYGKTGRGGTILGEVLARFLMEEMEIKQDAILIPVPLHPKKERMRGFNQTLLLSKGMKGLLKIRLADDILQRERDTQSQTGLGFKERMENVRGAFVLTKGHAIKGKEVILVDDVATTGSTLNECAKVLKKGGANKVISIVLARAREDVS